MGAQTRLAYADNTRHAYGTDGRRAAATALLGNYMAGSVRLRIRRQWVTCGDFIERLWWGDISIFARPRFCHSLIRQKPETILHSLGPSFYVGNNDTHPLKVVGGLRGTACGSACAVEPNSTISIAKAGRNQAI